MATGPQQLCIEKRTYSNNELMCHLLFSVALRAMLVHMARARDYVIESFDYLPKTTDQSRRLHGLGSKGNARFVVFSS